MLKTKTYKRIVRIICIVLLLLLVVAMFMLLKVMGNYLELRSIDEIWPEGENIIHQYMLVFFAVASVVFFIRMVWLEAKCEKLKFKLKTGDSKQDKKENEPEEEQEEPKVQEEKTPVIVKKSFKEPKSSKEQKALTKKVKALEAWKVIVRTIHPDIDESVAQYFKENPVFDPSIIKDI